MRLVDADSVYELPKAYISERQPSTKDVFHQYDFSDHNSVTRMGRGPTRLIVPGVCDSETLERLIFATAQNRLYTLYFPSQSGSEDDRYYQRVLCMPVRSQTLAVDLHAYTLELHALDGHVYDTETGRQVD